jgi:hypothetical protein
MTTRRISGDNYQENTQVSVMAQARSIVQPPLTPADRKALSLAALAEQRRDEQRVAVSYADEVGQ